MIGNVKVNIMGKKLDIIKGTTLFEISKIYQSNFSSPIILAKVDGVYKELSNAIISNCNIEFLSLSDKEANKSYLSGLVYLVMYAAQTVLKNNRLTVQHSIDKGLYIKSSKSITRDMIKNLKERMKEIIKLNLPIERVNVNRLEAIEYFERVKDYSKIGILKYNTNTYITLYKLGNMYNFFFSLMPTNTRSLERFDLKYLNDDGFVLLYQTIYMNDQIKNYVHHPMIFNVFNEYREWAELMNINQVPSLNETISAGNAGTLIRIDETLQSNRLLNIAKDIYTKHDRIKIVLISGPSSSGKTTTCNKLCMYLKSFGLNPKTISMDNYFLDREKTPKDSNGEYDFECLMALDLDKFDSQVTDILEGKIVQMPLFNFITGKSEPGEFIKLGINDILLVEGIHALNPTILTSVSRKQKYKIYISPLTGLNLDDQNRISTSDNRLLRRIIRDNGHRGNDVETTMKKWTSVRRGEEKFVFPYQDEADYIFNSALIYEIGVLKVYVEPLLYSVEIDSPYYAEAKRLINMLKMFLPIPSEEVPNDSLLREFIGGSCFKQ